MRDFCLFKWKLQFHVVCDQMILAMQMVIQICTFIFYIFYKYVAREYGKQDMQNFFVAFDLIMFCSLFILDNSSPYIYVCVFFPVGMNFFMLIILFYNL